MSLYSVCYTSSMCYTDAMFPYKSEKLVIFNLSHSETEELSYATLETLKIRLFFSQK